KRPAPDLLTISGAALDPSSCDGPDGIVEAGHILNAEAVEARAQVALVQAAAGRAIVPPSGEMAGRVGAIREALDEGGYTDVAILAYTAKYASAFYGPFRDALDSAPRHREGIPPDKKTYQMDPANSREALRELHLDLDEGADMVMVKP